MIGSQELIVILLVAVVFIFGAKKIPELMKGLGQGIREFKKAKDEVNHDLSEKKTDGKEKS